jgi:hypothetical protein
LRFINISLFIYYFQSISRTGLYAGAASNALERIVPTKGGTHGICRTDRNAHQTADAKTFGKHHHSMFVHREGTGGTRSHTSLTLITNIHIHRTGIIMNLNAGQTGIILFEIKSRTSALANMTGYTPVGISF